MYIGGRVGERVGSGRVNVSTGRVGSGPRKVTRGQLWSTCYRTVNYTTSGSSCPYIIDNSMLVFGAHFRVQLQSWLLQ